MKRVLLALVILFAVSTQTSFAQEAEILHEGHEHASPSPTMRQGALKKPALKTDITKETQQARLDATEKAKTARAALKEKIAAISDTQKQTILNNLDTRIATLNTNQTTKMSENLVKLNGILERISSKSASLNAAGIDTKTLDQQITQAATAISSAETAVMTQAGTEYVFQITDQTKLKSNILPTITKFRTDIKGTHQKVVAARSAVAAAAETFIELDTAPAVFDN